MFAFDLEAMMKKAKSKKRTAVDFEDGRPLRPVDKNGLTVGRALSEQAAQLLLVAYSTRRGTGKEPHPASDALSALMEELESALGVMASDPKVADVLHRLDGAVWDCASEHEDRAWYAAWSAATRLTGGAR